MSISMRVSIAHRLWSWACDRSGHSLADLGQRFPRLPQWMSGNAKPTYKQVQAFAAATHTPVGVLFLDEPPVERLPIADLRTFADQGLARPTSDLLETIFLCQQRQDWYRDFALSMGERPGSFIGSLTTGSEPAQAAATIGNAIAWNVDSAHACRTWEEALTLLCEHIDAAGILVMKNGIVGSNTHRRLNPDEFRGFALSDPLAPLSFINAADTKAAQMFTVAHELAHLWLGESGVSDTQPLAQPQQAVERWCNAVAAELLAPAARIRNAFNSAAPIGDEIQRLARLCKISTLVVLRRLSDIGHLPRDRFWSLYHDEAERLRGLMRDRPGSGGNFYATQQSRLSERFTRAVIVSAQEGNTLYRDAFSLLGVRKQATFDAMAARLGEA
jgi:Zn-dependent peptidase ImmA (M78 family)